MVDTGSELYVPAMIEYRVTADHPIRQLGHKLDLGDDGNPQAQAIGGQVPTVCPAPVSSRLRDDLADKARIAHRALGCRDYSLFDFRVDPQDRPWLLEAGLFWTFGAPSMISKMITAHDRDIEMVAIAVWRNAMTRTTGQTDDIDRALLAPMAS